MQELSDSDVQRLKEFIEVVSLQSVDFHEVTARRQDVDLESRTSGSADEDEKELGDASRFSIEVQIREGVEDFAVRLNAKVELPIGSAAVSVAAEYSVDGEMEVTSRLIRQFVNDVAVMTAIPYLREGMAGITSKVFGKPLYIPIIPRGDIAVDVDDVENT